MKKSFLLRVVLLLSIFLILDVYAISCSSTHKEASNLLIISGLKEVYSTQEPIDFVVYNNTEKTMYFSCPVEIKIKGEWGEIINSIDAKNFSKKTRVWELAPKQSLKLNWDRKQQQTFHPGLPSGIFRFKIEIMEKPGPEVIGKIFSKEFKVVPADAKK